MGLSRDEGSGVNRPACAIGVDVGGTFTDFVLADLETGAVRFHKRLTEAANPAAGVVDGILELLALAGQDRADVATVITGSTLGSNAILERRGAPTGLLTTDGFVDLLDMGTEQRYDIHDLFLSYPEPLVPRRLRRTVAERITATGEVRTTLQRSDVRTELLALAEQGVASIAVCFLNGYINPDHERIVAEEARALLPDLTISVSHKIAPEIREYPRLSTTVINAYIAPVVGAYLSDLATRLAGAGIQCRLFSMLSSGGTLGVEVARHFPVRGIESGPAGGVMSAAFVATELGEPRVLAFDMGGTTAKASLILDGLPQTVTQFEVGRTERFKAGSGLPVQTATLDLLEVGGGGGSIARIDRLGLLQVGPHSAGSDPGPACYGLGGEDPTVTDAMCCLGYLPDSLLGGGLVLDRERATTAVTSQIADPLGVSCPEAAWGIYSVVAETMASALRVHSIERGVDPRQLTMFAFGGAGPLVSARVAASLRCSRIVIPVGAGVTSAHGFLRSPIAFEISRSVPGLLDDLDWKDVDGMLQAMEDEARRLTTASDEPASDVSVSRSVDLSLAGQAHELTVSVPAGPIDTNTATALRLAYEAAYQTRYRDDPPRRALQAVTWRVVVSAEGAASGGHDDHPTEPKAETIAAEGVRPIYFDGQWWDARVRARDGLRATSPVDGPMVIEDRETTILVPPGWSASTDPDLNVILTRSAPERTP